LQKLFLNRIALDCEGLPIDPGRGRLRGCVASAAKSRHGLTPQPEWGFADMDQALALAVGTLISPMALFFVLVLVVAGARTGLALPTALSRRLAHLLPVVTGPWGGAGAAPVAGVLPPRSLRAAGWIPPATAD
jgi:hypothetical protein